MEPKNWTCLFLVVFIISLTQADHTEDIENDHLVIKTPVAVPKESGSCPSSEWIDIGSSTCFFIEKNIQTDWENASMRCQEMDPTGRLASFHSRDEYNLLKPIFTETKRWDGLWIGLHKDPNTDRYGWTDKTAFDFNNWGTGYPEGYKKRCGYIDFPSLTWRDATCNIALSYVCAASKAAMCEERKIESGNFCARSEHGGKCTITCDENFKKIDDKGRTVLEETDIFCSEGKWDSLPVTCVVQTCEDRMHPRYPNKTWHEFCAEKPNRICIDRLIQYFGGCECEPGFAEKDSGNCIANQFCRGIDSPVNGKSDCQRKDIPVKEQCQFSCDQGHTLKGKSSLTCKAGYGKPYWDGEAPTCQVKWAGKCEEPAGEHLLVEPGCDRAEKGTCRVYCQAGFQLVDGTKPVPGGKKVLTCTEEFQWGELPTCRVPTCPEIFIWKGHTCNESETGGVCTITCDRGHHTVDPRGKRVFEETHVHCKDGTWDPIPVACVATQCSDVKDPENPNETWLEHCKTKNAECGIYFEKGPFCDCKFGFQFDPVKNDTCVPTVKTCDDYDGQSGMIWNKNCARKPFHRCEVDELQGPECVCQLGFRKDWWDNCIRATDFCQGKDNPSNGRSDCHGIEVPFKGQCTFTCNPGYELKGDANLTCVANETATNQRPGWDYHAPTCQKAEGFSCADRSTEDSKISWTQFCRSQNRECVEGEHNVFCGSCLEGFQEDPQNNYTCTVESSSICPNLLAPLGGLVAGDCKGATVGEKCLFACETGKKLVGEGILTCHQKGTWNFKTPTCTGSTVDDCQSIKTGTGMSWKEACERENRACVSDPREGPKCGCQEGLTEICLCTKKRQLLQGFLSYIIEGRNAKYISEIAGPNNKYISEVAGQK